MRYCHFSHGSGAMTWICEIVDSGVTESLPIQRRFHLMQCWTLCYGPLNSSDIILMCSGGISPFFQYIFKKAIENEFKCGNIYLSFTALFVTALGSTSRCKKCDVVQI